MLEASWKLDNLSWYRICFLYRSWDEISDIKLDDFRHIPLHANYDVQIPSRDNPATTVDSALPNSHRSRAVPSSCSSSPRRSLPDSTLREYFPKPTVPPLEHSYAPSTTQHRFVGAEPQFVG